MQRHTILSLVIGIRFLLLPQWSSTKSRQRWYNTGFTQQRMTSPPQRAEVGTCHSGFSKAKISANRLNAARELTARLIQFHQLLFLFPHRVGSSFYAARSCPQLLQAPTVFSSDPFDSRFTLTWCQCVGAPAGSFPLVPWLVQDILFFHAYFNAFYFNCVMQFINSPNSPVWSFWFSYFTVLHLPVCLIFLLSFFFTYLDNTSV